MKLSDYVFNFVSSLGTDCIFVIIGGANSHLADSLSKNKKLKYVCTQHEQAAAMAAEGYARASGKMGVVLVTSGPGGTNAMTGLCGAWCDSVPTIFISGQVPSRLTTSGKTIRQLGVQQINITDFVGAGTKFAVMLDNPMKTRFLLEKAAFMAKNGRPGPTWLDIPTELQYNMDIEPDKLERFKPPAGTQTKKIANGLIMRKVVSMIKSAKRPVLIAGHGIRISGSTKIFQEIMERLGFPVITTWNGIDLLPHSHPLYIGCAGVMGQRGSNFAIANSDLILSIGSRLDTRQVGNSPQLYAVRAKKIVVDIDEHELNKDLIKIDLPIRMDAGVFLLSLKESLPKQLPDINHWRNHCANWRKKYSVVLPEYNKNNGKVNSYIFVSTLCQELADDDMAVTDMGTSLTCTMQTFFVKGNQRLFTNTGFASMGFGLPGTIGAWFGRLNKSLKRIIGIYGDGGFQMNIQELQTVKHYNIPIKMFILNNKSYLTIKNTQELFFDGHLVGSSPQTGYSAPDFMKVAKGYDIPSYRINGQKNMRSIIKKVLGTEGPALCEVMMLEDQPLIPLSLLDKSKGYAGSSLEVMYPFLSDEEQKENMI